MDSSERQRSEAVAPLIGVSTSELRRPFEGARRRRVDPAQPEIALALTYLGAVEDAGGLPVILPPIGDRSLEALLGRLDGICLSGGPDLDPSTYGAEPHDELGPTETEADHAELAAVRLADRMELPMLALCRGIQTLNVARGGTLHQHLPDVYGLGIDHSQTLDGGRCVHGVEVAAGSRLARICGAGRLDVNSFHHQAIDRLGEGLEVVARSDDGLIEAVEAPGERFCVGVQWHAETVTAISEHAALFEALVAAAQDLSR